MTGWSVTSVCSNSLREDGRFAIDRPAGCPGSDPRAVPHSRVCAGGGAGVEWGNQFELRNRR
jgi:hypothetical protein